MRRFLLGIIFAITTLALAIGAWWYFDRVSVGSQLASYRIGQAATFDQAKREIAAVERQDDSERALRELVSGWRTGNPTFDFYLASYLGDRECGEALRRLFSLELAWRPELLADWAHFWSWRSKQAPADEIASIVEYLEVLSTADPPRQLTWREVLDLQAAFSLTSHRNLAHRLAPDNWSDRYRQWREQLPAQLEISRPKRPLPGWQGSLHGAL